MKLLSKHIELLTPLEKKAYGYFLHNVSVDQERRDKFISLSHNYREGDENVLPFPERSPKGIMLLSLCKDLKMRVNKVNSAVIMEPIVPEYVKFVKEKLLALGTKKVYSVAPSELLAAIYGNGRQPFSFYRENSDFSLPGISHLNDNNKLLCAINPPPKLVTESDEYKIQGILLRYSKNIRNIDPPPLHLFSEAAELGLTNTTEFDERVWLSKEP